jgi:hypothetical protein
MRIRQLPDAHRGRGAFPPSNIRIYHSPLLDAGPSPAKITLMEPREPRLKEEAPEDAITRAIAYGIDISLLEANLRLTPRQRMEQHDAAVQFVMELQAAKKRAHAS